MPTPIFACGAECGMAINNTGAASTAVKHWDTTSGVGSSGVDTATFRGNGTRSFRFQAAGARASIDKTVSSLTTGIARFYIRFGSFPTINVGLGGFLNGSVEMGIGYDTATQALVGKAGAVVAGSFPVVLNTWYRIDLKVAGLTGTTHTTDWQVDGAAQTQASRTTTASSLATFRIGVGLSTAVVTGTMYADDILLSATVGDYPLGAGTCVALVPLSDGTHSFNAAGDFKYNNSTNVATNATDTFGYIDEVLDNILDFIAAAGAATGEYLEWAFGSLPGNVNTINGVEVVSSHHAAGTAANTQTLRLVDGGTTNDVFADADLSNTTLTMSTKQYATAPSSGLAWTVAKINALKARWAASFVLADITPVPYIDGLRFEVDYAPVSAVGSTPLTLTSALNCFEIDHNILFNITFAGASPTGSSSGFVHRQSVTSRTQLTHRFTFGETRDT